ncbi:TPA: hypothetical protein NKA76_004550 [Vibrio parahaemolyticus]|nr:hypothetical protein [Vibrio parahaemolyticus]
MKIVCGSAKQVQISNEMKSEGSGENKREVTYYTHKFLIDDKAYRFKRSNEPLNISDGNVISLGIKLFGNVGRIYNHTTEEYSHRKPLASAMISFCLIVAVYLLWTLIGSDLLVSLVPQNIYNLIRYSGYVGIILIVLSTIREVMTFNSLRSAYPE